MFLYTRRDLVIKLLKGERLVRLGLWREADLHAWLVVVGTRHRLGVRVEHHQVPPAHERRDLFSDILVITTTFWPLPGGHHQVAPAHKRNI